jgi:molybdopterin-guanine dinucleotide biosynthesis protein A
MTVIRPIKRYFPDGTICLVLCGGQSNRMGKDKSMLQYYDKPQRYHVYDMLLPFCEKVFISCNREQVTGMEPGYNFIKDDETFGDIGPMAALLSAFTLYPKNNILQIGCDYPFLNTIELEIFSGFCTDIPVSFYNEKADIFESMLAWYPYTCFDELKHMHDANRFSLQYLLRKTNALKYLPKDINSIKSIDTYEAYIQTCERINTG